MTPSRRELAEVVVGCLVGCLFLLYLWIGGWWP